MLLPHGGESLVTPRIKKFSIILKRFKYIYYYRECSKNTSWLKFLYIKKSQHFQLLWTMFFCSHFKCALEGTNFFTASVRLYSFLVPFSSLNFNIYFGQNNIRLCYMRANELFTHYSISFFCRKTIVNKGFYKTMGYNSEIWIIVQPRINKPIFCINNNGVI